MRPGFLVFQRPASLVANPTTQPGHIPRKEICLHFLHIFDIRFSYSIIFGGQNAQMLKLLDGPGDHKNPLRRLRLEL
jgi:hypothetical protein